MDERVSIKWPNDIWVGKNKISGILIETVQPSKKGLKLAEKHAHSDIAVIGIGLNVSQKHEDFAEVDQSENTATSLALCGVEADRLLVMRKLMTEIDCALDMSDTDGLLNDWRSRCLQFHQPIKVKTGDQIVQGYVDDLDPQLGLIVRNDRGMLMQLPASTTMLLNCVRNNDESF